MKKLLSVLLIVLGLVFTLDSADAEGAFITENRGQWAAEINYALALPGINFLVTNEGFLLDFYSIIDDGNGREVRKGHVAKMVFQNAVDFRGFKGNFNARLNYNYNNRSISGIKQYANLVLENLYPGINLKLLQHESKPRYDFIVKPGANPSAIRFRFEAVDGCSIDWQGNLVLKTSIGDQVHGKLFAYQFKNGKRIRIDCNFTTHSDGIGFDLGDYDKNSELIIDPLIMTSYVGGNASDILESVTYFKDGEFYVCGNTQSNDFVTSPGAYQSNYIGNKDIILQKYRIDASVRSLVYSTIIGTADDEVAKCVDVDPDGNVYIAGYTNSKSFPTKSSFNATYSGEYDIFLMKFNSTGSELIYSGLWGGTKDDIPTAMKVTDAGAVVMIGNTKSTNMQTVQPVRNTNGGDSDMFLLRIASSGQSVLNSTYYGGTGNDYAWGLDVDDQNNVFVTGETNSSNFPIAPYRTWQQFVLDQPYDYSYNGYGDAFVIKFIDGGTGVDWSTFFGGGARDIGKVVIAGTKGTAYVFGETQKETTNPTFPTTDLSYQKDHSGGWDGFFIKLDDLRTTGSPPWQTKTQALLFSTFFGSSKDESVADAEFLSSSNNIKVVGTTNSNNYPIDGVEGSKYAGQKDVFITQFSLDGSGISLSGLFGGTKDDIAISSAVDDFGDVIVVGSTNSSNFVPATSDFKNAYSGGDTDGFVFKFSTYDLSLNFPAGNENYCPAGIVNITWTSGQLPTDALFDIELINRTTNEKQLIAEHVSGRTYKWTIPNDIAAGNNYFIKVYHETGLFTEHLNPFSINKPPVSLSVTTIPENLALCEGGSVRFEAQGQGANLRYQWKFNGKDIAQANNPVFIIENLTKANSGNYEVVVTTLCPPEIKSSPMNLSVLAKTVVTKNPVSEKKMEKLSHTFSIEADGVNLKYQWQKNQSDLIGEVSRSLTISSLTLADSGYYRCIVTGDCSKDTTDEVLLEVTPFTSVFDSPEQSDNGFLIQILSNNSKSIATANLFAPFECELTLGLYDNLGNRISQLFSGFVNAGWQALELNIAGISPGVYWIYADCAGNKAVRKILIIE